MSKPRTPSGDKPADDQPNYDNKPAELPNYAQDTLKEVLGWYGLGEGEGGDMKNHVQPHNGSGPHHESRTTDSNPLDLTNGHSQDGTTGVARGNVSLSGHRKLIGMRFLFPPLSEEMSLFEKAKIWVARHDYKYFVGWSEDELQSVDPILRPIAPVTQELYKLHMNRSEYCRNVKLKYCLESEADWAKEFQEKLRKPVSEGGFTGLCQAKIAAAELWRKHSENYRSHQARYPNPKSKHRSVPRQAESHESEPCREEPPAREEGGSTAESSPSEAKRAKFDEDEDLYEEAEGQSQDRDDASFGSSLQGTDGLNVESEGEESGLGESHGSLTGQLGNKLDFIQTSRQQKSNENLAARAAPETESNAGKEDAKPPRELKLPRGMMNIKEEKDGTGMMMNPALQFYPLPMHLYPAPVPPLLGGTTGAEAVYSPSTYAGVYSSGGLDSGQYRQGKHGEKPSEYKRSERGLSFLFPSLSDHNLSLLDKVKITVIRHKNNYFLGWSEEELKNIDPLIRPKMVVSSEIYKEYCHRNAMKYDSNLQFAMESPEQWAKEFRAKLSRPPSEGGFSSLCEVKLEAGRLWREYSGKYRMHNIVKWQMDMNSAGKQSKKHKLEMAECEVKEEPPEKMETSPGVISPSPPSPSGQGIGGAAVAPHSGLADTGHYSNREETRRANSRQKNLRRPGSSKTSQCTSPFADNLNAMEEANSKPSHMMDTLSLTLGALGAARALEQSPLAGPRYFIPHPDMDIPSYIQSMAAKHAGSSAEKSHLHALAMKRSETEIQADLARRLGAADKGTFCLTPDFTSQQESLFKPLPKYLSVAEQVYVWLERHKHNYFLAYSQDQLSMLGEFLRPNVPVTEEVFKKYIPESMVDILGKIQYMMMSAEPPAKHFQERLHKPAREGGFANFEEALTEAVVLWSSMAHAREVLAQRMKYSLQSRDSPSKPDTDEMNNNSPTAPSPAPGASEKQPSESSGPTSAQLPDNTADSSATTQPSSLSPPALGGEEEDAQNDVKDYRTERTLRKSQTDVASNGSSVGLYREENGPESPPILAPADPEGNLWRYRNLLQAACREDPSKSWHSRLNPYMSVLRENLGVDYTAPLTNIGCAVDMLLATLHLKQCSKSE